METPEQSVLHLNDSLASTAWAYLFRYPSWLRWLMLACAGLVFAFLVITLVQREPAGLVLLWLGFTLFAFYCYVLTGNFVQVDATGIASRHFFRTSAMLWADLTAMRPKAWDSVVFEGERSGVQIYASSQLVGFHTLLNIVKAIRPDMFAATVSKFHYSWLGQLFVLAMLLIAGWLVVLVIQPETSNGLRLFALIYAGISILVATRLCRKLEFDGPYLEVTRFFGNKERIHVSQVEDVRIDSNDPVPTQATFQVYLRYKKGRHLAVVALREGVAVFASVLRHWIDSYSTSKLYGQTEQPLELRE